FFIFQAEDGIRARTVTGVQTCALPIFSRGNQSATMGHYSTANGTVAGAETSQGGKVAASSTKWGNSAVGKTASGNMYAGHDGNRSEERRVGKECKSGGYGDHEKKRE